MNRYWTATPELEYGPPPDPAMSHAVALVVPHMQIFNAWTRLASASRILSLFELNGVRMRRLQDRFQQLHDFIFRRPICWELSSGTIADSAGIGSLSAFSNCMTADSARISSIIVRDVEDAKRIGGSGTPTVLIDGVRFVGTIPQKTLDSLVEHALKRTSRN